MRHGRLMACAFLDSMCYRCHPQRPEERAEHLQPDSFRHWWIVIRQYRNVFPCYDCLFRGV